MHGAFCAGLDLAMLLGKSGEQVRAFLQALYVDLNDAQYNLGKPSIAAVGGAARGGGMTIAISCDVILAGEQRKFRLSGNQYRRPAGDPFRPSAAHRRPPSRFRALFSGRSFDAQEAFDLGLVSKIVPDAELDAAAMALAEDFAAKSPAAMRLGRAAFMRQNDYRRNIATAVEDFCNAVTTPAAQEGIRAFVEKRAPNWAPEKTTRERNHESATEHRHHQ